MYTDLKIDNHKKPNFTKINRSVRTIPEKDKNVEWKQINHQLYTQILHRNTQYNQVLDVRSLSSANIGVSDQNLVLEKICMTIIKQLQVDSTKNLVQVRTQNRTTFPVRRRYLLGSKTNIKSVSKEALEEKSTWIILPEEHRKPMKSTRRFKTRHMN